MKSNISICARINAPNNLKEVEINNVLAMIKNGVCYNQDLKRVTALIQSQSNHDVQNHLKLQYLPVALFNGTFSYKNSAGLKEYSNFTAIDFDRFNNEQEFNEVGSRLCITPCVYAVFRTPSGRGLKAIVMHDNDNPEYHEELYLQLLAKFNTPATDTSVGDIARGNYICYDPNLWVNNNCTPYHFTHDAQYTTRGTSSRSGTLNIGAFTPPIFGCRPNGKKSDESIINILNARWRKEPDRWKEGNRANSIFNSASELCRAGVEWEKCLAYLIEAYSPTGISINDITYQAGRGCENNRDSYGKTRSLFDNYGKRGY